MLHTEWSRERAGDFDLTGKCDWKRDRKCSTWGMRRRFAAVLVITWLYDCLSTPIKIWNVPVTVPRDNAVLFMKWHTQTISKSLNNSNKLLPEKTTDIIKWCHGCGFPCEKMSEEQVLKFHTLMTCHYPDLGNCTSSVWNFCRVILQTSFCRETCNRGIA